MKEKWWIQRGMIKREVNSYELKEEIDEEVNGWMEEHWWWWMKKWQGIHERMGSYKRNIWKNKYEIKEWKLMNEGMVNRRVDTGQCWMKEWWTLMNGKVDSNELNSTVRMDDERMECMNGRVDSDKWKSVRKEWNSMKMKRKWWMKGWNAWMNDWWIGQRRMKERNMKNEEEEGNKRSGFKYGAWISDEI